MTQTRSLAEPENKNFIKFSLQALHFLWFGSMRLELLLMLLLSPCVQLESFQWYFSFNAREMLSIVVSKFIKRNAPYTHTHTSMGLYVSPLLRAISRVSLVQLLIFGPNLPPPPHISVSIDVCHACSHFQHTFFQLTMHVRNYARNISLACDYHLFALASPEYT